MVANFGANMTYGEMIFGKILLRNDKYSVPERARLRPADNEKCFGVQMATKRIDEGVKVGLMAKEAGAAWIDLNCGCPIYEATRRGLGAVLVQKPAKLQRLVTGLVQGLDPMPVTVKIRTGKDDDHIRMHEVVRACGEAGAAAVCVHGRTMQQRYSKSANWTLIREAVEIADEYNMPVIGNGDILTHYEATRFQELSGVSSVMIGRGALIKPWIFEECKRQITLDPTPEDRIKIYRELTQGMKDHFGDDARGKRKGFYFLPWHFSFFCRYRHLPPDKFLEHSLSHPLIQSSRIIENVLASEREPIESLLTSEAKGVHEAMAHILWDASSDEEALDKFYRLSESDDFRDWELELKLSSRQENPAVDSGSSDLNRG
ncbi:hypothetical protein AAMO2058_000982800 [Amorphochlora amoebiformis]